MMIHGRVFLVLAEVWDEYGLEVREDNGHGR